MTMAHGGNLFEVSRARGWDWRQVLDFSASINPLGPAPGVLEAVRHGLDRVVHYPEREPLRLREALARTWKVDASRILLGNGATELLHFFARTEHHARVALAVPLFSEFHRVYPDAALVPAADPNQWPKDGLLVLSEPNNPTGAALDALPQTEQALLVDESFLDFTGLPSAARLLDRRPNLYVLRSLTKFYALPGLRIGALLASSRAVERWRTQRPPWQVNVLAEEAALAAVPDKAHAARTIEFVRAERGWLAAQLALLPGAAPIPSVANYILVRLQYPAAGLCRHLLESKILARNCAGWPGICGEAVRVAVRTRPENERLVAAWKEFSCAA